MVVEKATPARSAKCEKAQVPQGKIIKKLRRLGRIKGQPRSGRRSAKRIKPNPPPRLRSPGGGNKKSPRQLRRQGVAKKNPPPAGGKGSGWPRKKNPDSRWQGRRRVKVSMRACEAKKHTHSERNVGLSQARRRPRPAHHETRAEKHPHTPKKRC